MGKKKKRRREMKIVVPVDESSPSTGVCISFGRAPFFLSFDTDTRESIFLKNDAADSQGGAGIKAAQKIVDSQAAVLLTPRCGDNAADVLKAAGIKLYKTTEGSAMDNIQAFQAGSLTVLTESHPGLHGHGG
jgi:predicted Fe-Mo cluster-binding NifX family protein